MVYTIEVVVALIQFTLSFYAFWLIWRVLLPELPGPRNRQDRIAPYAGYFTNPFIVPVAKALRVSPRLIALIALTLIAMMSIALNHLPGLFG